MNEKIVKIKADDNVEEVHIHGWKGRDKIEIVFEEDLKKYRLIEHRKEKETGEIVTQEHIIDEIDVLNLHKIIKHLHKHDGKKTTYREIVRELIDRNNLVGVDEDSFNGGRNRAKFYFPIFYYPLKVLEGRGIVQYFGRGGVRLIG